MNNWWIASLEHFGLLTREESQHISDRIKQTIHRDNYVEAFQELEAILKKFEDGTLLSRLMDKVGELETEIEGLKNSIAKKSKV